AEARLQADGVTRPPLYQLLYEAPLLPRSTPEQQRLKMLIWIRHMDLGEEQLALLRDLRETVLERQAQITRAEQQVIARYADEEAEILDGLWQRMAAGAPADAPEVVELTDRLAGLQRGSQRERELLTLRIEGIRSVMEAEGEFLRTLSPRQEARLADSLFFLRNLLDPVGNPEDFRALVGTTYDKGEYAVLTRGLTRWGRQPLNIGGLWSDEEPLAGGALHEAQREVLLYLALLEPGMDEAIDAARALLAREVELELLPDGADTGTGAEPEGDDAPPDDAPAAAPPDGDPDPHDADAGDAGDAAHPAPDSPPAEASSPPGPPPGSEAR
ncbi:MAG: hypothetical protein D6798_18915, partial [Deltaproteobacteria bacterium]